MPRGNDAKAARKEDRKEARDKSKSDEIDQLLDEQWDLSESAKAYQQEGENDTNNGDVKKVITKKTKRKKTVMGGSEATATASSSAPASPPSKGIKTGPLVMLLLLTGTTLLPALLYAGDWFSQTLAKGNLLGKVGYKLGIGASPRKRVLSFYEKHDPTKIDEVDSIMGKYYGDYGTLVKRLERKYGDYGYFINWEQDEAAMTLAFEKLKETRDYLQKEFDRRAPRKVKIGMTNAKHNLDRVYRKSRIVWKKKVWPHLEPYLGAPKGGAQQKRKDRMEAEQRKGKKKRNHEFEDDRDEF